MKTRWKSVKIGTRKLCFLNYCKSYLHFLEKSPNFAAMKSQLCIGYTILMKTKCTVRYFMMLWLFWFRVIMCLQRLVSFWPVVINWASTASVEKDALHQFGVFRVTSWFIFCIFLLRGPSNPSEQAVLLKNSPVILSHHFNRITKTSRQLKP